MTRRRRLALLLTAVLALGSPPAAHAAAAPDAPAPDAAGTAVRLLQANIGNINVAPGGCGDQAVKLCLRPVEERIAARLDALAPQVVALQEVLPALVCRPPERPGAFGTPPDSLSLRNPQHLCNPQVQAGLAAQEQLDRLLPPDRWETGCNDPRIDPADPERVIPPWDCVGVRRDAGRIASFTSLPGTAPGAVPGETCDNGFTVSVARLDLHGTPLQVTTAHPDSGPTRAGCRAEKLARLFAALGGASPPVPTVVAGDINLDPYRAPDVSTRLWDRFVSAEGATPYRYRSGIAEADPPPFTSNICGLSQEDPTGLLLDVVQPPVGPCASTLDHVAATSDVVGPCDTLGEAPGDSGRLDGGGGTDHRAISCHLVVAAAGTSASAAPAPAAPSAAPAPAEDAAAPAVPAASARALPATGPLPGLAVLGAAALLGGAVLRRRRPRA